MIRVILKKEFLDIVSDKKYMLGFAVQFLLLLAVVPTFSSYLGEEGFTLPAPTMKNFVPVGVVDKSSRSDMLMEALLENERLEVYGFDSYPQEELRKGSLAAVLIVPQEYDEASMSQLPLTLVVSSSNIKGKSAQDAVEDSLEEVSAEISDERKAILGLETKDIALERRFVKPVVIERGGSRYSSFFLGYLIPIVLFFPIFMSSSLIVDSVVGEKERKTMELLITSPIVRNRILFGKFLAIYGFTTTQILIWLFALKLQGVAIANAGWVFLLLAALNLGLTATAFLLASYSRSVKEANLSFMLLYVLVFVFLITSLSLEFFNPKGFFELSPFNSLSRLAVGEGVGGTTYAFLILGLCAYSSLVALGASRLMDRDDVIYGPRPGPFTLLGDAVDWMASRLKDRAVLASSVVALSSGLISIPLALFLEISAGVIFLYAFGYSNVALAGMILTFAFIEESLKPIALYSLQIRRGWIKDAKGGAFYGALAGFSFFLLENTFVIFFLLFSFPALIFKVLSLRTGTTLLLHLISSGIVGMGISKSTKRGLFPYLLLATGIHALYNLVLLGVSL